MKMIPNVFSFYLADGVEETCANDPIDYDEWEFDTGNEICIREVICTDDDFINAEQIEDNPEVEWEFDERQEVCIASVCCEGQLDLYKSTLFLLTFMSRLSISIVGGLFFVRIVNLEAITKNAACKDNNKCLKRLIFKVR